MEIGAKNLLAMGLLCHYFSLLCEVLINMMKKILLMCCMIISLMHAEFKAYEVFLPISASLFGGQGLMLLGFLGIKKTKKMILDNKLDATCYVASNLLLYGFSSALVNFVNNNNNK